VAICPSEANEMVSQGHIFHREKCVLNGKCESVCLGGAFKLYGKTITIDDALKLVLEDRAFYENSGGGVTVSGGEPLLQADFVHEFFINLKKKNIHTALDTSGQVSWSAFKKIIPVTDMFLYDIKHIDSKSHKLLTGHGSELILENLRKLSALGCRIEIRIPLVPGSNNDDKTIHGIGNFLSTLKIERIKVLPYHSMARSKYEALNMEDTMPHVEPPTDSELNNAIDILRSYGLNAVSGRE
jgi:pyruvate formate lyase activating enzyme